MKNNRMLIYARSQPVFGEACRSNNLKIGDAVWIFTVTEALAHNRNSTIYAYGHIDSIDEWRLEKMRSLGFKIIRVDNVLDPVPRE